MSVLRNIQEALRIIEESKLIVLCHPSDLDVLTEGLADKGLTHAVKVDTSPYVPLGVYYTIDPTKFRVEETGENSGD